MANCELSIGFDLDCKDGVGGIKQIVLANWNQVNLISTTIDANEIVTALPEDAELFYFELPTQTGSFEETINFNRDAGTIFYTQTVNVMFQKLSAVRRLELQNIATVRCVVFVQDANSNWWAVGLDNGADLSTSTGGTGTVFGDAHGYTLSFVQESVKRAYTLTGDPSDLIPA
jgi:hypothetical protein